MAPPPAWPLQVRAGARGCGRRAALAVADAGAAGDGKRQTRVGSSAAVAGAGAAADVRVPEERGGRAAGCCFRRRWAAPFFTGTARRSRSPSSSRSCMRPAATNALLDAWPSADALAGLLPTPQLAVKGFGSAWGAARSSTGRASWNPCPLVVILQHASHGHRVVVDERAARRHARCEGADGLLSAP